MLNHIPAKDGPSEIDDSFDASVLLKKHSILALIEKWIYTKRIEILDSYFHSM